MKEVAKAKREIDIDKKREAARFDVRGPSPERLAKAAGAVSVGGLERGTRIYFFADSPLDRLYSRLTKSAGSAEENHLRTEYIGLQRYKQHWHHAGLQASLGSVDLNRIFASDPGSMSGMAKSERQAHHRQEWRAARDLLGHRPGIVVDNVVCSETSLEVAGFAIGWASAPQARSAATEILREAGSRLAKMWGIG
jgi:hypothetical protein